MKIGDHAIGVGGRPFIVADLSASHNGVLENGIKLIDEAKRAGADAVKFQAYLPELISCKARRPEFIIKDGPWKGWHLYDLYEKAHTPRHFLTAFFEHARKIGITAFSTVCSEEDVDFLEPLGNPAYKVASLDIQNSPLIEYTAGKRKPMIISTGMASDDDVEDAWYSAYCGGGSSAPDVAFLHCTSGYPTPLDATNMQRLRSMRDEWDLVGWSDHTIGPEAPVMATTLGGHIIEKHITLNRDGCGPDDHFASLPFEFSGMVRKIHSAWMSMLGPSGESGEEAHAPLRPSLHVVKAMKAGEVFTKENVRAIRPSGGLPPKELHCVLGKPAERDIEEGEPLASRMINEVASAA